MVASVAGVISLLLRLNLLNIERFLRDGEAESEAFLAFLLAPPVPSDSGTGRKDALFPGDAETGVRRLGFGEVDITMTGKSPGEDSPVIFASSDVRGRFFKSGTLSLGKELVPEFLGGRGRPRGKAVVARSLLAPYIVSDSMNIKDNYNEKIGEEPHEAGPFILPELRSPYSFHYRRRITTPQTSLQQMPVTRKRG
jgi:hypothetical protein